MGGGKGKAQGMAEAGYYSDIESARIAKQLFQQTEPARQAYYGAWKDIAGGEMPFGETAFPAMYQAGRAPIESQYDVARQNVMETIPQGGRLGEALTNVEIARSQGLQDLVANYLMDQVNKMYGAAFQVPQMSISGLQGVGQHGVQTAMGVSQGAQSMGNICCFNFLEAEGEIYWSVRRYRDEHYPGEGYVGKGYLFSARILVPLMRDFKIFKQLIRIIMTKPLRSFASWYYGENRYGFIFWPIAKGWVNFWRLLGLGVK